MYVNRHNDYPDYHNVGQLSVISKQRRKGIIGNYGYPQNTRYYTLDNLNYPYPLDDIANRNICVNIPRFYSESQHNKFQDPSHIYQPPCHFFYK
jgi:hypothetical protein